MNNVYVRDFTTRKMRRDRNAAPSHSQVSSCLNVAVNISRTVSLSGSAICSICDLVPRKARNKSRQPLLKAEHGLEQIPIAFQPVHGGWDREEQLSRASLPYRCLKFIPSHRHGNKCGRDPG